ncbi:MAG: glycosyltransferase family 4 protein [Candidatus Binataceae bacterium]
MSIKILFLNPTGHLGGAERVMLDLMASIRTAWPHWILHLIAGEGGALLEAARAAGVAADVIAFPPALATLGDAGAGGPAGAQIGWLAMGARFGAAAYSLRGYLKKLRGAIITAAPDVVHSNGFKMHLLAVRAAPPSTPVLWHVHDYVGMRPVMSRLMKSHARRCAAVVANSASVACDAHASLGGRTPVFTLRNAIDLARFRPAGPRLDLDVLAGMEPSANVVRVGLPATTARWKGHEVFLRALAAISAECPLRGYVIGGPLYRTAGSQFQMSELREMARRLGLERRVGFTGFVADMAAAMRALDIVVHASTQPEPFGLVIAEAMACERAVITSATGGAAEIIERGVNALTHPAGDAVALSALITRLAVNSAERHRLGGAALRTATAAFDRARMAGEIAPIYRRVCGNGGNIPEPGVARPEG